MPLEGSKAKPFTLFHRRQIMITGSSDNAQPTSASQRMPVRYTLRIQFGPHQDTALVRDQLLKLCQVGKADEVMFFLFAEELNDGHESLERVAQWLDAIRPWKSALESCGIEVSLNPWHTLLHADRGRRLRPDQPWQPMVDFQGRAAEAVVCPLDPGWQDYYSRALQLYAAERFRVIWIDDDFRYHNHAPLNWGGCWCARHLDEFSRRSRASATREQIVANVLRAGPPHPWRKTWLDMWDDLQLDLVRRWRKIAESAGSRLGLMSSDPDIHSAEGRRWPNWWTALGTEFHPVAHRPSFWSYGDADSLTVVRGISLLQQNRSIQPENVESDPEIENFPYGRWIKSFRQLTAQMALAQVFGSERLAISLFDFMGNLPDDDPERARYLGRIKPMLAWLGEQFPPSMTSVGIGIPWHPDLSRLIHTDGRMDWRALHHTSRGWEEWLAPLGHACQKQPHQSVNALAGPLPWAFDDQTLRRWLSRGLLLDGPAAAVLVERRLGPLIGLSDCRFVTHSQLVCSTEESLDSSFGLRNGASMSVNSDIGPHARLLQGRLDPGAQPISVLRNPSHKEVGHGAFVFQNELGGRVAVVPWNASAGSSLCVVRQHQLNKIVQWLGDGRACGSVQGGPWLVPQFLSDGRTWRGVVWNACPDAISRFKVVLPDQLGELHKAVQLSAEGELIEASVDGGEVRLSRPMHQWELVVLNSSAQTSV